jgi:TonB family protein
MNNDSPPGSSRPPAGGEFTWPPTSDELDAIQVIPLDDASSARPIAAKATELMPPPRDRILPAPVITSQIVAPISKRGRGLRMPHMPRVPGRDDLVLAGVTLTSLLAIATAAFMQFSDAPRAPVEPNDLAIAPLAATAPLDTSALPLMSALTSPLTGMAPIAAAPVAALDTGTATPRPRSVARATPSRASAKVARAHPRTRTRGLAARGFASHVPERRRVIPVSEDYARPRLISPEHGRSGKLVLLVEVRKNGKVGDVDVLSSDLDRSNRSHRDLQRAAVSAVKRWRYTPAVRGGEPTASQIRVVVDINLDSSRAAFTEANARRRAAAADRAADSVLAAR